MQRKAKTYNTYVAPIDAYRRCSGAFFVSAAIQPIGRRLSLHSHTLTCDQTQPVLMVSSPVIHVTCVATHLPTPRDGRLSWPGWLTCSGHYPQSGHMSAIDQAKTRESPPAKERRAKHWATPPTPKCPIMTRVTSQALMKFWKGTAEKTRFSDDYRKLSRQGRIQEFAKRVPSPSLPLPFPPLSFSLPPP